MAGFTPYGDPFERVNKTLAALDADAAQLEKETQSLGSLGDDIEKQRASLERQAARGARIGQPRDISGRAVSRGETANRRASQDAIRTEEALNRQRAESLRLLQRQRQFGPYAFTKSVKDQAAAQALYNTQLQRSVVLQASASRYIGGGGRGLPPTRQLPPGAGGGYPALPPGPPPAAQIGQGTYPRAALPVPGTTVGGSLYGTQNAAQQETRRAEQTAGRYAKSAGTAAKAERDWGNATRYNMAAQAAGARGMRSYGALTTEFFQAAARGTVTIRELGFQTATTIGKFGGWLTAGAALYTALGAMTAIGKGAIDSASGVNQLARVVNNVDPSSTTRRFRALSQEFNLPIKDVSDAAYQMGKVFHDQNDALDASRSVLYAVKVGELDTATASRYLTSITQGFNLTAAQQGPIFDQINQAQNKYAISTQDALAGVAKAAGTFHAAGGDFSKLLALITTARRATGQTGEVIGTAFARSPNFLRKPQNVEALRKFGIDAKQPIDAVIEEAFKVAGTLSGERLQQLAAAIGGPQYGARIFTPLLQQYKLYQKVLAETSPEKSKGSAQRELNTTLGSTSERLKAIIIQLEVLGSNLESAGFFEVFKAGLGALTAMLNLTNSLFEAFNALPKPLRTMVALLLQAGAAIKVLRFFNLGQSFRDGGIGSRIFTGKNQSAKLYGDALAKQQETLAKEYESAGARATRASLSVQTTRTKLNSAVEREMQLRSVGSGASQEAQLAATQERVKVQRALAGAEAQALEAEIQRDTVLREQLIASEQQALITKKTTDAQARSVAAIYGNRIPTRLGSPDIKEAERIRQDINTQIGGGAGDVTTPSGMVIPASSVGKTTGIVTEQRRLTERLRGMQLAANAAFAHPLTSLQGAGARATESFRRARGGVGTAASTLKRIGPAMTGLGNDLKGMFGPLDALLFGAIFAAEVGSRMFSHTSETEKQLSELQKKTPHSAEELQAQIEALQANAGRGYNVAEGVTGIGAKLSNAALKEADSLSKERNRVKQALTKGKFISSGEDTLFPTDIKDSVDSYIQQLAKGNISGREFNVSLRNLMKTIRHGPWSDTAARNLALEVRSRVIDSKGLSAKYQDFAQIAGQTLADQITAYSQVVQGGLGSHRDITRLIQSALPQISENLKSKDPKKRVFAVQALDSLTQGLQGAAQTELETALTFAKGQGERNKAYEQYARTLDPSHINRIYQQQRGALRKQLANTRRHIALQRQAIHASSKALDTTTGIGPLDTGVGILQGLDRIGVDLPGPLQKALNFFKGGVPPELRKELDNREKQSKAIHKTLRSLRKAQQETVKRLKKAVKEEADNARFEENFQLYDARTELGAARMPEGVPKIEYQLGRIRHQIERAIHHYGRNSQEVIDLLTKEQGLINDRFQAEIDLIRARGELYVARSPANDPREEARRRLKTAQDILDALRSSPRASKTDILNAATEVATARKDLAQQIRDEAEAIKHAQFELLRARADGNDVRLAVISAQEARYNIRHAKTRADRISGRADLLQARHDKRDAIANREIEDIQFQADIGKLTLQQQISAYNRLLHTLTLTKDIRRDLRRKIYDLKQQIEGDQDRFALDVGNIKLPTIYEIRRAIQGGVGQGPNVSVYNNPNVSVNVARASDAGAVADVLDSTLGTSTNAAMRAAGLK